MAGKVEVKAFGKEADLLESYQKVIRKQGQMLASLNKIARASKSGASTAKKANKSLVSSIAGVAGAYVGVQSAIRLIGDEIVNIEERWRKAADTIKTTAGEIFPAISALPDNIRAKGPEFLSNLVSQAVGAGTISRAEAFQGIQAAGSTTLGATPKFFSDIVTQAARASQLTPGQDSKLFASAAASVADVAGLDSARAGLGLVFKLGTGTPILDLEEQAKNIPRSLAKIMGFEPSIETGSELLSSVLQASKDPTGLRGATAAASIAERLRTTAFLPNQETGKLEFLPEDVRAGGSLDALRFVRDRISGLPEIEQLGVAKRLSESGVGKSFVSRFFKSDEAVLSKVSAAERLFGPVETAADVAGLEERFESTLALTRDRPEVQQFLLSRAGKSAAEELFAAQPGLATRGILRDSLGDIMQAVGSSAIRQRLERARGFLDSDSSGALDRTRDTLVGIRGEFEPITGPHRVEADPDLGIQFTRTGNIFSIDPNDDPGQPAMVNAINIMVNQIDEMKRSVTNAVKENTAAVRNPSGPNGATNRESSVDVAAENQ